MPQNVLNEKWKICGFWIKKKKKKFHSPFPSDVINLTPNFNLIINFSVRFHALYGIKKMYVGDLTEGKWV